MSPAEIVLGFRGTAGEAALAAAVAGQLSECLADPGESPWPVVVDPVGAGRYLIVTLTPHVDSAVPVERAIEDLRASCAGALGGGCEMLFLCTALRAVADPARRAVLLPRLRALNLATARLSHALGLAVADVDRTLALFGAGPLRTDYRLGGLASAEMAAHAVVTTMLAHGLDSVVPVDRQERALARHGGVRDMAATVDRRLGQRAAKEARR